MAGGGGDARTDLNKEAQIKCSLSAVQAESVTV